MRVRAVLHPLLIAATIALGCGGLPEPVVVVYTALDREFSEPVLKEFTRKTGIRVLSKYDVESTKSVGLVQSIMAERGRPRCDVFWNNEIVGTLRLKQAGLLEQYRSPSAESFPEAFKGTDGTWCGFAARARVLIVNTDIVTSEEVPGSLFELTDEKWKGLVGIAKPVAGTTATHVACLFAVLGEAKAKGFFLDLKSNDVQVLAGNKQVAQAVATGELAVGLTDTDDAMGEIRDGRPVMIAYLDAGRQELGTLFIPNSVAVIKGGPHPAEARALIDFLLQPEVEVALARGPSAQIPLNSTVETRAMVKTPREIHAMPIDFEVAARHWEAAQQFIAREFLAP